MSVIKDEYVQNIITRCDLLPISFLKKSAYTGSRDKLRYKIEKGEIGEEPEVKKILRLFMWTTPFAFDKTSPEEIETLEYPFEDASLDLIIEELNRHLEAVRKK